jgi:hypothetical protein
MTLADAKAAMGDAPERIWAWIWNDERSIIGQWSRGAKPDAKIVGVPVTQYLRDDIAAAREAELQREIDKLSELLYQTDKRLQDACDRVDQANDRADTARQEGIALGLAMALLKEAAADLAAYIEHDYPASQRSVYPDVHRRWDRDMDLVRRIDAALEQIAKEEG